MDYRRSPEHHGPVDREALGVSWRESIRYIWQEYVPDQAQRLSPGVPARLRNYPRARHGFFHLLGASPDARDAVDTSAEAVRRVLGQDPADKPGDPLRPAEIRAAGQRNL